MFFPALLPYLQQREGFRQWKEFPSPVSNAGRLVLLHKVVIDDGHLNGH